LNVEGDLGLSSAGGTNPEGGGGSAGGGQELDFERAVEQVEKIIERIESGEIGLEASITEYERGVALIRRCRAVLERAEQRVDELTGHMNAPPSAAPQPPAGPSRQKPSPPPEPPF
jgi:exodeoxyribonuclease VII small subunit